MLKDDPGVPKVGDIDEMVGAWPELALTVNATVFDVPPGVVTDT